jgi:UDP-2,3-diacylglucosamine hydrolase
MIYFISDVHLGHDERSSDRQREKLFTDFLDKIKDDCEVLYLVGDIFDYWFEYKTVIPKIYVRSLAALANFAESGKKIEYLMGNHDFGHLLFFEEELGIKIIKTDIEREHNGKRFYISHGDGKAYNDQLYLVLRKLLRNRFALWLFGKLHPDFGIKLALGSSRKSRKYTIQKDSDGMRDFARGKIEKEHYDYVIMGHRHIAEITPFDGGKYVNIGEWLKSPTFGRFDGKEMYIEKVYDFLSK